MFPDYRMEATADKTSLLLEPGKMVGASQIGPVAEKVQMGDTDGMG